MAVYERGQERGNNEDSGHKQRLGSARRTLPRVDFEEMNFEQRRPSYDNHTREDEERNEGEPQKAGKRRDDR